jgi:ADP-ribose pyrophosphatase
MKLTAKHRERFVKIVQRKQGYAVGFRFDQIRLPDGKLAQREFMTHPGAVGALAFAGRDRILLVKQYRHPVGEFTYEIPAGKLDKGEDPLLCVKRELAEETGYRAKKIRKLIHFWPTAAFSDEVIHLYVAEDLVPTDAHPDEDEYLELVTVTRKQLERMIQRGQIHDSKTLIAYFAWRSGLI